MRHISFLFNSISFDAQSIHVLFSCHNNRHKQSLPRFPLYMLWDLILTSYTINSLPVCCSTNKLLTTWQGKGKFFCIRFNSQTKQKPATKMQDHVFSLTLRTMCRGSGSFEKIFFSPKLSLSMVLDSSLQLCITLLTVEFTL